MSWISESDDFCFHGDPAELIAYRRHALTLRAAKSLDPLTNLVTRQRFNQTLLTASPEHPVSIVLCDLDGFKLINDEYGHSVGDQVLKRAARIFKENCDRSATVGRIGGEEFMVVCNRDEQAALMLADKIRNKISRADVELGVHLKASMGVTTTLKPVEVDDFIFQANQALYSAKANGRNQCITFGDMQKRSLESGNQVEVVGLENQARVLAERVANVITMQSRKILKSAREEADIDGLTGCFTRRYLDRRLAVEYDNREKKHFGCFSGSRLFWPSQ